MCDVGYLCANFVFLGLSVFDLGPMYATDRQTSDVRQTSDMRHRLMSPTLMWDIIILVILGMENLCLVLK